MARLILLGDDERIVELQSGSNTLGREPGNAIFADSPGVSRHHATIRWESPYCRIIDHESTNGTFVNGERIEVKGVKTGDILRTGPMEWRIELETPVDETVVTTKEVPDNVDATVLEVLATEEVLDLQKDLAKRGRPLRSDRDLATLYRTVDTLVKGTHPKSLLEEVVEVLVEAFSASGVAAFLYDTQTGDFEMAAGTTSPPGGVLPVSRTIVRRAIEEQETLLVRNAAAEGLSAESGSVTSLRIQSALAAPLHSQGIPLGALQLSRGPDQRAFNEKDLKLFSVIAELVALALVNCRRREELESENIALGEIVKGRFQMLGNSAPIRKVFDTIEQAAKSTLTILVQGSSGTGKELVARAIHSRSARRTGPFVAMNCAALPQSLAESELFGHEKGAFTGATDRHQGCFERSSKGTLFLDEVGDLPAPIQAKLLRVLEQGELTRVGGEANVKVDVRLVAATNRDLEDQVREGKFRQDLFYRLQVVVVQLPLLSERREDIPLLAEHFLGEYQESSGVVRRLSPEVLERLVEYPWPGNVRELRNAIVRAAALSQREELSADDFGFLSIPTAIADPTHPLPMDEVEKRHILNVLDFCDWKREKAAEILGIDRKTLFNKIHRYKIGRNLGEN